nr:TrkA domain-containing protein [uncultured Gammaproteobacteria bacterium]
MPEPNLPRTHPVIFLVLREMRTPMLVLILVYAVAILGMALMPAKDGGHMSLFHAFYFVMYTATTTGFGEVPQEFSNAQRLWASGCLFVTVVAWLYAIGSIIRLLQNVYFQRVLVENRFVSAVRRLPGDFFILCGFGDTGSLLARGLSNVGFSAVVLDKDEIRIKALGLRDYSVPMPGLCCDATLPQHLLEAGLQSPRCQGVVALTRDEEANLKIAAVARLLNPKIRIIVKSGSQVHEETLATLGARTYFVDPFKTFAEELGAAICNPYLYLLNGWLAGAKNFRLDAEVTPLPRGHWIVCGFGRMGREVYKVLTEFGLSVAVISEGEIEEPVDVFIRGSATAKTLKAAGIERAVGIVAATDDDGRNLSILINARAQNPKVFTIVRQNQHQNELAFNAAHADMIMQPSLITARRIFFMLTTPLLRRLFIHLLEIHASRPEVIADWIKRLRRAVGARPPRLLTLKVLENQAPALWAALEAGAAVALGDLLRDPRDRRVWLPTVPLLVRSDDGVTYLPDKSYRLRRNDRIVLCGTEAAHRLLEATVHNEYTLYYLVTGQDLPRAYWMRWLRKWQGQTWNAVWPQAVPNRAEGHTGPG